MPVINTVISNIVKNVFSGAMVPGLTFTTSITITRITRGAFVPSTGKSTDTTATYTVTAAIRAATLEDVSKIEILERGDLFVTISRVNGTVPTDLSSKDTLTIGGLKYQIVDINPRSLGATTLTWMVIARRL